MNEALDVVSELAAQIAELRQRMKELDAERATVRQKLEEALDRFGIASGAHSAPLGSSTC